MRWDKVERDLYLLSRDFGKVAESLMSLAASLKQERENGTLELPRRHSTSAAKNKARPPEADLLFPEDPFE